MQFGMAADDRKEAPRDGQSEIRGLVRRIRGSRGIAGRLDETRWLPDGRRLDSPLERVAG